MAVSVKERVSQLRDEMKKRKIDVYIIPTSDFHNSEYVGEYFKARKFMTGFTGSAGTAVVTMEEAGLWTDGRYFTQAEKQLEGSTVKLFKMGVEGVPTLSEYVRKAIPEGGTVGFDGRVICAKDAKEFEKFANLKHGKVHATEDLVDIIWEDRPALSEEKPYVLDIKYAGKPMDEKISDIRKEMENKGADLHILTSLYDIAWVLNIRGNDIANVPVVLSYLVIGKNEVIWFLQTKTLDDEMRKYLSANKVTVKEYGEIFDYASSLKNRNILLDENEANFRLVKELDKNLIIDGANPSTLMKAIKNDTELKNTINAHIKDGVAVTKFIYWLKKNIGKIEITEISASDYIEDRRREQEGLVDLSFTTISAYGENAAMMHYSATEESNATLKPEGFLLVDSGGHYLEGTTDITRTIALGELTDKMKEYYTRVVRSNMTLSHAKFLYGCSGLNLDILARGPLWDVGMDYRCGTGHGVGYLLNVHEGPNGFRWRVLKDRNDSGRLEEGMITTDEPGVYIEGEFGIRIENELICRKAEKNEYGQFMCFEDITYAPIDLDAIIPEMLSEKERGWLNDYHANVYKVIAPFLDEDERAWLKENTRAI
ncbi:MAG: aminopeptidase P family protein [Lachnospiraceae bacterium]|nr:aminopeptidase P family protein [Lachnospiraceae bacterium]